jgi:hypothetical protein
MVTATPFSTSALAGCQTSTGPCSTDGYGNTYRTEQNLGGGYNTFRNGVLDSQTSQTTSGSWRERSTDGGTRTYNYNPYEGDGGTPGYR